MISPEALEPKCYERDKYIDGQPEIRAHKTVRGRSPRDEKSCHSDVPAKRTRYNLTDKLFIYVRAYTLPLCERTSGAR